MTQIARDARVRARQRELGGRMIEDSVLPLNGVVALGAAGGESRQLVIRIRRIVEAGDMTGRAIRGRSRKLSTGMTLHACHTGVRAAEGKRCVVVIE